MFQICHCGTQPGYPHDAACPFPLFTDDDASVERWARERAALRAPAHDTDDEPFPCTVCGAPDADWDDNADGLRCPDHHRGGREQDRPAESAAAYAQRVMSGEAA